MHQTSILLSAGQGVLGAQSWIGLEKTLHGPFVHPRYAGWCMKHVPWVHLSGFIWSQSLGDLILDPGLPLFPQHWISLHGLDQGG